MTYAANLGRGDIVYPGLIAAWSAKGKSNDDADREILKDLTGNGHDITLNGFAFAEMSGYGGYNVNFLNFNTYSEAVIEKTDAKITIYNTNEKKTNIWKYISGANAGTIVNYKSYKIKVSGLNEDEFIRYKYSIGDDFKNTNILYIKNGVTEIPEIYGTVVTDKIPYTTLFDYQLALNINKKITIEQIPNYEDALVFDGVDDYGINENMPILTDYTIIAKRKYYTGACLFTKGEDVYNSAFIFEGEVFNSNTYNFGRGQDVNLLKDLDISWQTKLFYNEQPLLSGNAPDKKGAFIGKISEVDKRFFKGAFYSAYLFDRSLDEQEIKSFVRKYIDHEYLLPSEIPTPDCYYDFSQGSNDDADRNTIKDYSGNGNDAVAHNFAFSGMSGYGGYLFIPKAAYGFTTVAQGVVSATNNSITVLKTPIKEQLKQNFFYTTVTAGQTLASFKIKVSGLSDTGFNIVSNLFTDINIGKDGIYEISSITNNGESNINPGFNLEKSSYENQEDVNITVELLPEYEGALVFDGVDDYVSLDAFDSGFKTVFMVMSTLTPKNPGKNEKYYHQKGGTNVWGWNERLAYQYDESITLINGIKNTTLTKNQLALKKHLAVNYKDIEVEQLIPKIGGDPSTYRFGNMALYKFLGFKEVLTEEQINAIIKKYNLLDGVDEIEVR